MLNITSRRLLQVLRPLPILMVCLLIANGILAQNSLTAPALPAIKYNIDVDEDGLYDTVYVGNDILQPEGKVAFDACFSSLIHYPFEAYEQGIKGVLLLEVHVDKSGKVTQIDILKSLFKVCDESAKAAFIEASEFNYTPLVMNNRRVQYKMEYPVLFWLE